MLATKAGEFHSLNQSKANFDFIYRNPDPREYYRVLCGLDYVIPDLAKPVFRSLIAQLRAHIGRAPRVLDIGCSYGINAALARFPLDLQRLAQRYTADEMRYLDSRVLAELDRSYFRSWPLLTDAVFVGLDSSEAAVEYALRAGIIEAGIAADLERRDPGIHEIRTLRDVDLIISTGCVGYVGAKTFARLLDLQKDSRMPWIANFVLRMFPYRPIEAELENFGLVTEKFEGVTFEQRQFCEADEMEKTISAVLGRGMNPAGKEADGFYHAELFVSRPRDSVEAVPLNELVTITSGISRPLSRRLQSVAQDTVRLN